MNPITRDFEERDHEAACALATGIGPVASTISIKR